ncbi:MAG TPA: BTAD domain-containing putative transcriptional regulator [Gaiellaceae bacterium]|nr:BTAD domain-containing putative transcriptional regulator [Gaiellaceae bacterium]
MIEFRLLGPVEVSVDGQTVPLGAPKQRALLAELLLHRGETVTRTHLIDALWDEEAPEKATSALQVYVHGLRRAIGKERIETHGSGYRIRIDPAELDVERFETLLDQASRALAGGSPEAAASGLDRALTLWRGPALADLGGQPTQRAAEALDERRVVALELRNEAALQLGRHDDVLAEIEQLVAEHPYRERLREQWILALYRAGRQKDALDAYRDTRALLIDELGVEPGPALQELERAVLRQDESLAAPAAPSAAPLRLPTPPTRLVGRRLELVSVTALVRDVRLVTLTGPGGAGKTRLALAAAAELGPELPGGAVFVDLAPITDASLVLQAVADTLEVPETADEPVAALATHVGDREQLVVLDNFEQVQTAAVDISALLAATKGIRVLVTSRVPLRLSGEHEYPVPPLPIDDAVQLFADRARALDPSFAVGDTNVAHVSHVCRRLDGLPLAIELAAARTRVLPPAALAERLTESLDLLTEGARDLPERQQTLRATLDWSYQLLADDERALLARLSVFAGGITLDAIEAVVGPGSLSALATLVDNNLVRRVASDAPRFALLETIRDYAAEQVRARGEHDELARRHAEHFLAVAEGEGDRIMAGGEGYEDAFERLDAVHDNIRAAFAWAADAGEVEIESRLVIALRWYWLVRGHLREARAMFDRTIADSAGVDESLRAAVLAAGGSFPYRQGDLDAAREIWSEALALYWKLDDKDGVARCIAELGGVASQAGELDEAAAAYRESHALFVELGRTHRASVALANLAAIAELQGDHEAAFEYGEQAIAEQRASGDFDGLAVSLHNLARSRSNAGDRERARELLAESFELAERLGYREVIAYSLETSGELAFAEDDGERAARLLGAADELFGALGVEMGVAEREGYERTLSALASSLGAERLAALVAEGRTLSQQDAIAEALASTMDG